MVIKSNLKQKIVFVIVFFETRQSFLNNLKLALCINRVTPDSPFLP